MTPEEAKVLAQEVVDKKSRSYVQAAQTLATFVLSQPDVQWKLEKSITGQRSILLSVGGVLQHSCVHDENALTNYKDLWDQSCQAVKELCELAGSPPEAMHDVWTLKAEIERLKSCTSEAPPDRFPAPLYQTTSDFNPRPGEGPIYGEGGWIREGHIAVCPECKMVQEGTISWHLEHEAKCAWKPAGTWFAKRLAAELKLVSFADQPGVWAELANEYRVERDELRAIVSQLGGILGNQDPATMHYAASRTVAMAKIAESRTADARPAIGSVFMNSRGRAYEVIGWMLDPKSVIIRDSEGICDVGVWSLMVPENGWKVKT